MTKNNKITKDLKHARFTWDEKHGIFSVESPKGNKIELNKVYSFALMRFIIRIAQKNFAKNILPKKNIDVNTLEDDYDDPRQQKFDF
tara:strand:+ start:3037 stop:3297 length:261 start_codon:yes stop_codon:yes gene_type:complete